jgi:trehalose 6-phosphate phosphatase
MDNITYQDSEELAAYIMKRPPEEWSLFFDLDGTLVDIVDRPPDARIPNESREDIRKVNQKIGNRLTVITGRDKEFVNETIFPSLPLAGAYITGTFMRSAYGGQIEQIVFIDEAHLHSLLEKYNLATGMSIERKPFARTIHYRGSTDPSAEGLAQAIAEEVTRQFNEGRHAAERVKWEQGNEAIEIGSAIVSKGTAISNFLSQPLYAGTKPAKFGDSEADASGMKVAAHHGGLTVGIGPKAPEISMWRLRTPEDLRKTVQILANTPSWGIS